MFNLWPWEELPVMPPEIIFVSRHLPLNIYDFACWARQTVVALTVVSAHRPTHHLEFTVDELKTGVPAPRRDPLNTWAGRFQAIDVLLHFYERRPIKFLRRAALRKAERWIVQRQEADGSWGGIQPPWVYSLIALRLRATPSIIPSCTRASRDLTASPSKTTPVGAGGVPVAGLGHRPRCHRVRRRGTLAGRPRCFVRPRASSSVRRSPSRATGHSPPRPNRRVGFRVRNDTYPDIDDAAEVVLALGRTAEPSLDAASGAASRGSKACSHATGAGPRLTSTTSRRSFASSPSATSVNSSIPPVLTSRRTCLRRSPGVDQYAGPARARGDVAARAPRK